jgi:2-succinyl-5-enolpyruvyl-6-hydroxy-3-cyclohexene-1-carboxylate synthase
VDVFLEPITAVNEIAVARQIALSMPVEHGLFLSNSMPVREMDMYAISTGQAVAIGGNRGASGIDGIIATACGFTAAGNRDTTLLIGDLAFLHDLNSLALVKALKKRLIIVVINNNGGGIFSFLPIAQSTAAADVFEPCFGTPHGLQFNAAATMFGLKYVAPQTMMALAEAYQNALIHEGSTIIEVKTERQKNHHQHRELQDKIAVAIDAMLK